MMSLEKSNKLSNSSAHLSLSLDTLASSSSGEINMESEIKGGPPNSTISSDTLKSIALFLSSSSVHFSFNDFRISILPFQLAWIYLTLEIYGKNYFFLASFINDKTFMKNVDT